MTTDKNDKLTFWKRKLQEYRNSGLSRRVFSELNGVNKSVYCKDRIPIVAKKIPQAPGGEF